MEHLCLRDEDLAGAAALPADSPARYQWMACARCRARVAAFAEFLQPSIEHVGPEWDDADARLAAALESEIHERAISAEAQAPIGGRGVPAGQNTPPGVTRPASENRRPRSGPADNSVRRFWGWLLTPSLRPVAALTVLLVALAAVQGIRVLVRPDGDAIVLREGATGPSVALEPGEVTRLPDGALSLSWGPVEGVDRYDVVLYGEDLVEKRRFDAAAATSITIPAEALAPSTDPPQPGSGSSGSLPSPAAPLFWRVIASRGGDIVAQSKIRSLPAHVR